MFSKAGRLQRAIGKTISFAPKKGSFFVAKASTPIGTINANLPIPDYLSNTTTYLWCYLSPMGQKLLDNHFVASVILWGQMNKLIKSTTDELQEGNKVLQPASVYGKFSIRVAEKIGSKGSLLVQDIAPIQVQSCSFKLRDFPQCSVTHADAQFPKGENYDAVTCFFLLHEVPEDYKQNIVNSLLKRVKKGGKVVFIDYHKPSNYHPLKQFMTMILVNLEPFATSLWNNEIKSFADIEMSKEFEWKKDTFFGGLYQKVVATRL